VSPRISAELSVSPKLILGKENNLSVMFITI
jgi:hypothetical protein